MHINELEPFSRLTSHNGAPASVLFGPGDIAQAHKPDEWVELVQLDRAKAILLRFLQSLP